MELHRHQNEWPPCRRRRRCQGHPLVPPPATTWHSVSSQASRRELTRVGSYTDSAQRYYAVAWPEREQSSTYPFWGLLLREPHISPWEVSTWADTGTSLMVRRKNRLLLFSQGGQSWCQKPFFLSFSRSHFSTLAWELSRAPSQGLLAHYQWKPIEVSLRQPADQGNAVCSSVMPPGNGEGEGGQEVLYDAAIPWGKQLSGSQRGMGGEVASR